MEPQDQAVRSTDPAPAVAAEACAARRDVLTPIGGQLRAERERRGVAIAEAARITKIRGSFLEALERNDWGAFPASVFARGFLRSYAEHLGLASEHLLQIYDRQQRLDRAAEPPVAERGVSEARGILEQIARVRGIDVPSCWRSWIRPGVALAGAGVAATVVWVLLSASGRGDGPATAAGTAPTTSAAIGNAPLAAGRPSGPARLAAGTSPPARSSIDEAPLATGASSGAGSAIGGNPVADKRTDPARLVTRASPPAGSLIGGAPLPFGKRSDPIPLDRHDVPRPARQATGRAEPSPPRAASATARPLPAPERDPEPARPDPTPVTKVETPLRAPAPAPLTVPEFRLGTDAGSTSAGSPDRFEEGSVVWFRASVYGGRPGDTIRHVWRRGTRTVAVASVDLGDASGPTESRLQLVPGSIGEWTVEARDAAGRVLARARFTCVLSGGPADAR